MKRNKIVLSLIGLFVVGFGMWFVFLREDVGNTETIRVYQNGQLLYKNLRIGVFRIIEEEYIDDKGKLQYGNTVWLNPYLSYEEDFRDTIVGYQGIVFLVGEYKVEVLEIVNDENGEYVLLKIDEYQLIRKKELNN